ncbi:MAG: glutathione peroxidase [Gammaproteobacteria bacterium]|nr:glutathione peroxidase [Gammaproteobacteria bacterium]
MRFTVSPLSSLVAVLLTVAGNAVHAADCPAWLDQDMPRLRSSETINLCDRYAGQPMLLVNTASHCGYTPQFKGLEALNKTYREKGLIVVGFPSDAFRQEADDEAETAEVCFVNYGVTFDMTGVIDVKGARAHPIFAELARQTAAPAWNFNKYLVDRDGHVQHFGSNVTPESEELRKAIEQAL